MTISSTNTKPESGFIRNIFLLPSRLCIDAPVVAVSWSTAIEYLRNGFIADPRPHVALYLTVWVIYLFDRLYDSRPGLAEQRASLRHQFAHRNRKLLLSLLMAALGGCLILVLSGNIERFFLLWGAFLAAPVFLYFAVFRFFRTGLKSTRIPMKEFTIGLCFSAGVCLASGTMELAQFLPLGALFTLNCLIISRSEAEEDAHSDPAAFFSTKSDLSSTGRKFAYLEVSLMLIAGTLVWITENPRQFRTAVMLASLLQILLIFGRQSSRYTQALADTALLTAWPVLWVFLPD